MDALFHAASLEIKDNAGAERVIADRAEADLTRNGGDAHPDLETDPEAVEARQKEFAAAEAGEVEPGVVVARDFLTDQARAGAEIKEHVVFGEDNPHNLDG